MGHEPRLLRHGRIVRSEEPLNLEMPFENLDGFITPTKSFYVRTHFPIPKIDRNKWRLRVEGEVETPFEMIYGELIKLRPQNHSGRRRLRKDRRSEKPARRIKFRAQHSFG